MKPAKSAKSFFSSQTVLGALLVLAIALVPKAQEIANESRWPTPGEWVNMVGIVLGSAYTLYARYSATDVLYTPQFLPGRNEEDIASEEVTASTDSSEG